MEGSQAKEDYAKVVDFAMEAGRVGAWDWDLVTGDLFWNKPICRLFGVAFGEKRFLEDFINVVHPGDRERIDEEIKVAFESKGYVEYKFRVRWTDGSVYYMWARGKIIRDENRKPVRMYGCCLDITERENKDHAIQSAANYLDEVANTLKAAL